MISTEDRMLNVGQSSTATPLVLHVFGTGLDHLLWTLTSQSCRFSSALCDDQRSQSQKGKLKIILDNTTQASTPFLTVADHIQVSCSSQINPLSIAHGLLDCSGRTGGVTGLPLDRTDRVMGQRQ